LNVLHTVGGNKKIFQKNFSIELKIEITLKKKRIDEQLLGAMIKRCFIVRKIVHIQLNGLR